MVSTLVVLINIFSGCVSPEENDLLFITSLISIPLVVLLLVIVLLAAIFVRKNRATLKALAYYLLMINLMFIINFLTPYWILLESKITTIPIFSF